MYLPVERFSYRLVQLRVFPPMLNPKGFFWLIFASSLCRCSLCVPVAMPPVSNLGHCSGKRMNSILCQWLQFLLSCYPSVFDAVCWGMWTCMAHWFYSEVMVSCLHVHGFTVRVFSLSVTELQFCTGNCDLEAAALPNAFRPRR